MSTVYVLSKDGSPLMPTARCGHVRLLLKTGKARVVDTRPFTIRLLYDTPDIVQPLYLGINPGRTNIELSVTDTAGRELMSANILTRNKEIPKLMAVRKAHRQHHRKDGRRDVRRRRARKSGTVKAPLFERTLPGYGEPIVLHDIRNKKARFNNRRRPEGWLTPTANHLLLTHLNAVKLIAKYVPVSDVVVELNRFAFMQLDNPHIRPWEYQKGQLYGYHGSVRMAVDALQDGRCLLCDRSIEHYHHIIPKGECGSNTLPNIAGLCEEHHLLVHTDESWKTKLGRLKEGLNKKYGALSVLNQISGRLIEELALMFPEHTYAVTGYDTCAYRKEYNIHKDSHADAYCIASVVVGNKPSLGDVRPLEIHQFRRHDRQACHQEMYDRKYYLNGKLVTTNRHKACEQKSAALDEYVAELHSRMTEPEVQSVIRRLKVQDHPKHMKDTSRALPGSLFVYKGKVHVLKGYNGKHRGLPDYYVDTQGALCNARKCIIIQNNNGLRIVG